MNRQSSERSRRSITSPASEFLLPAEETTSQAEAAPMGRVKQDRSGGPGRTTLWVDPRELQPHPSNPRVDFGDDELAALTRQIKEAGGNHTPVQFWTSPDGRKILLCGHRRRRAAIRAGTKLLCIEFQGDETQAFALMLSENLNRKGFGEYEKCEGALQLLEHLKQKKAAHPGVDIPIGLRALQELLNVNSPQTVANWILVAQRIPRSTLDEAGYYFGSPEEAAELNRTSVSGLSLRALLKAAKLTSEEERLTCLRNLRPGGAPRVIVERPRRGFVATKVNGKLVGLQLTEQISQMQSAEASLLSVDLANLLIEVGARVPGTEENGILAEGADGRNRLLILPADERSLTALSSQSIELLLKALQRQIGQIRSAKRLRESLCAGNEKLASH